MLSCPYCTKPLAEDSPTCPACSLSLDAATSLLGPIPLLNRGLTDTTDTLKKRERRAIQSAITRFERRHPGTYLNVVLRPFPTEFNLSTQLFWLFNTAGLSTIESKLEKNHDILIGVDPSFGRMALMVGYGLEPFVSKESVIELLESGKSALEQGQYGEALQKVIRGLHPLLKQAATQAFETLGIDEFTPLTGARDSTF